MTEPQREGSEKPVDDELPSAERLKAFTDAVVAIAMTLLILPLMDSVSSAEQPTAGAWIVAEWPNLLTFLLSFVLIAEFWLSHHRIFARVERVDERLIWLTVLWMLTIVWLPVATAITGTFEPDPIQTVLYVGSLTLTSLVLTLTRVYVLRHPRLHNEKPERLREGITVGIILTILFATSMVLMLLFPQVGYFWLFGLFLARPVRHLIRRLSGRAPQPRS